MLELAAALRLKDPAIPTRWFVNVPDVDDPYECIVETIEAPFPKIPAVARYGHARNRFYPGINEIDGLTLQFYETHDYVVTKYLARWRSKIVAPDGSYGVPRDYKRTIFTHLYRLDRNEPVITLRYEGCWPTDQNPFSLNYESDAETLQVGANFSVDRLVISALAL